MACSGKTKKVRKFPWIRVRKNKTATFNVIRLFTSAEDFPGIQYKKSVVKNRYEELLRGELFSFVEPFWEPSKGQPHEARCAKELRGARSRELRCICFR